MVEISGVTQRFGAQTFCQGKYAFAPFRWQDGQTDAAEVKSIPARLLSFQWGDFNVKVVARSTAFAPKAESTFALRVDLYLVYPRQAIRDTAYQPTLQAVARF